MLPRIAPPRLRRVLCTLAGCAVVIAGALPAGAQARTKLGAAKPFATASASVHALRDSLVRIARAQVGTRYRHGGTSPDGGFDCSGLVRYVMAALDVRMPRTAHQQATSGREIARDLTHLRPGDLLTFGSTRRGISHVGIYVGGGRYVHASSGTGRVIESDIGRNSSSLVRAWRGVRRVVAGHSDSTRVGDDS